MDVSWPPFFSGKLRRNVATLLDLLPPSPINSNCTFARIEAAADVDPMISHQSVDVQLAKFVVEPLRHLVLLDSTSKTPHLLSSSTAWMNIEVTTYNLGS